MKVKQIQLVKAIALNRDKSIDLRRSEGFITNGEWLIREDFINIDKFEIKDSNFWESRGKELSRHDRDTTIIIPLDKVESGLKTPKGLNVVRVILESPSKTNFNCYIQQVYFDKFILPLTKNTDIVLETSCPKIHAVSDVFDPNPYSNKIIIKYNNKFIGLVMPICVKE